MSVSWLGFAIRHNYAQVVPIDFSRSRTSTYIFAILKHFNINYTINPPEVAEGKSQLSNYPCTYEMALWIGLVRAEQCVYDVFCSRMTERGNGWRSKLTRTFCVKTHFFFLFSLLAGSRWWAWRRRHRSAGCLFRWQIARYMHETWHKLRRFSLFSCLFFRTLKN